MDFTTLSVDFETLSADELMLARRGQLAAREGAPLDRTQPDAWQAGWQLGKRERWTTELRHALSGEVAA